jgi:hypothetical protein
MIRILAALIVLGLAAPASATPEESRALVIELLGKPSETGASWGEPEVRPASNGDFVRVPNLKIAMPDGSIRVGTVDFIVSPPPPGSDPARRKVSIRLPPSIKLLDENDEPTGEIRFGENQFDGLWARDFGGFVDYAGTWREIAYSTPDGTTPVTLKNMEMRTDGKEEGDTWSGSIIATAKGLLVDNQGVTVRVDEISQEYKGEKIAMKALAEATQKLRALPEEQSAKEPAFEILESLPVLAAKLSAATKLAGVEAAAGGATLFGLSGLGFEISFTRESPEHAALGLGLGLDGIVVPAMPEAAPTRGGATVRLADIPVAKIWEIVVGTLRAEDPQDAMPLIGERLDELMRSVDAKLKVDVAVGAPTYSAVVATELRSDPAAPTSVIGAGQATVAGLDETIAMLSKPPVPQERHGVIGVAQLLKAYGKPRADGGKIVYDYALQFAPGGKVTINGQEFPPPGAGEQQQQRGKNAPRQRR